MLSVREYPTSGDLSLSYFRFYPPFVRAALGEIPSETRVLLTLEKPLPCRQAFNRWSESCL